MRLRFHWWVMVLPVLGAMACPKKTSSAPDPTQATVGAPAGTVSTAPGAASGITAQLVFTANVRGWVEPCGCTTDPLGGVDRIRGELARLSRKAPVLFFDAGNLLFDRTDIPAAALCQEDARVKLLLDSARGSGLALTGLGAFDLARGDAVRAAALEPRAIPAVVANAPGAKGTVTRRLLDVGGIKVGFTGATWPPDTALPPPDAASLAWNGLSLAHPVKSVAREAGLLRQEGAQVVVVLGAMPRPMLVKLAQDVPGLDLLVLSQEPGEEPAAPQEVARGSWLLAAGQQGQYLGNVALHLPSPQESCCLAYDDGGKAALADAERLLKRAAQLDAQAADFELRKDAANAEARRKKSGELRAEAEALKAPGARAAVQGNRFTFTAIPINSGVGAEPTVTTQLQDYKGSLSAVNLACEKDVTCAPAPAGKASFVGSVACSSCHDEAYAYWQKATVVDPVRAAQYRNTPNHPNAEGRLGHVRAWKTLQEAKATGNRDCIACHAVGFEEPGGFCKVADGEKWGAVGCESCHGPGSLHVESESAADIRRDVPEAQCRNCHHVPHILSTESFVYREKLRVILGPGHGEARLKSLGGG